MMRPESGTWESYGFLSKQKLATLRVNESWDDGGKMMIRPETGAREFYGFLSKQILATRHVVGL